MCAVKADDAFQCSTNGTSYPLLHFIHITDTPHIKPGDIVAMHSPLHKVNHQTPYERRLGVLLARSFLKHPRSVAIRYTYQALSRRISENHQFERPVSQECSSSIVATRTHVQQRCYCCCCCCCIHRTLTRR